MNPGLLLACALLSASGCATPPAGVPVDPDTRYRLVAMDGVPAGRRGFTITFDRAGTYAAAFDCNQHFGRYSINTHLVLDPGPSTLIACEEVDLRTGWPVVTQPSFGRQFLSDQPFVVRRRGGELTLTGRRHRYVLGR